MIIGLTGTFASGKDVVAGYLETRGYKHVSTSEILREEVKKRDLEVNRDNLRSTANEIVEKFGGDYLAKKALDLSLGNHKLIISGLRRKGEIDYLKSNDDFILIFVDAPIEIRYRRMKKRAREDEKIITLQELRDREAEEFSGHNSQRLDYCKKEADFIVDNSKDLDHLQSQINKIVGY